MDRFHLLNIDNLHANVEDKEILKGINLKINKGEVHVIMGTNGAGKSTLANVLMNHPKYKVTQGDVEFLGENINDVPPHERSKKGMFLSFQYPHEINGLTVESFLRAAKNARMEKPMNLFSFKKYLKEKMELLNIPQEYAGRYLNVGFSGGEKKKNEILQMAVVEPKLAILDETDSGLDVDAIRTVCEGVNKLKDEETGVLIITHHNKILEYIKPDKVHVLLDGKIVKSGDMSLAKEIEEKGYSWLRG